MNLRVLLYGAMLAISTVYAETSTNVLTVDVYAVNIAPAWIAGRPDSLGESMALEPHAIINSQGGKNIQNDISIRGSSFSEAGITISGLPLRNPQTEHFHAELPFSSSLFSSPRILTGLAQTFKTDGFLAGSINFEFLPVTGNSHIEAGGGVPDHRWGSLFYQHIFPYQSGQTWRNGISVFGMSEKMDKIDYKDNNLTRTAGGVHIQTLSKDVQANIVFGSQKKEFGVRGYYGVSPTLSGDETLDDTMALCTASWQVSSDSRLTTAIANRRLEDSYVLNLTPSNYINNHVSTIISTTINGEHRLSSYLNFMWRASTEGEKIESTRLGNHSRRQDILTLMPGFISSKFQANAGIRTRWMNDFDMTRYEPIVGVILPLGSGFSSYLAYYHSSRQPSYTELNYESPGSLGNQGLEPEKSIETEGGLKWTDGSLLTCKVSVFTRQTENTVDWIKQLQDSPRWEANNIGDIETRGTELELVYTPSPLSQLHLVYTYLDKISETNFYASRYILDFPEHYLKFIAKYRITQRCELTLLQSLRIQTDNPLRNSDSVGTEGNIYLKLLPSKDKGMEITFGVDNLWNDKFEIFVGQHPPRRRVSLSLTSYF